MTSRSWWTVGELAEHWRISADKVYDLLYSGTLRGHKIGKAWRISDADRAAYERGAAHSPEPIVVVGPPRHYVPKLLGRLHGASRRGVR